VDGQPRPLEFSDIEQEARLRIWRALDSEREIRDPTSYIYRVTATTTIDAICRVEARREEQLRLAEDGEAVETQLVAEPKDVPDHQAERRQLEGDGTG
jgi:RNA polymerase sigma-70 factor (ECF subfamily)